MWTRRLLRWSYSLLLLFVFFIPISSFISVRLLFVTLLLSVIDINGNSLLRASWDILIYLLILLLGLTYSNNLDVGFKVLETSFSFLAIPLVISRLKFGAEEKFDQLMHSFILGLAIACLICLINATNKFMDAEDSQVFFFYQLTSVINSHPTYFAYFLIVAITYLLYFMYYQESSKHLILLCVSITFFFCFLMLTGGQTSFISLLFVLSYFILKFFLAKDTMKQRLTLMMVSIMVISMLVINSFDQSSREEVLNDSWDRYELWRSAILANSNPILGVGTGDYKSVLNEYYFRNNLDAYAEESLNSHNQFIQIFFSNGIFGLLAVIIIILRPVYMAFKKNDQLGILLMFPFLIYGITEVFLGRYQGVVFFALLHQTLVSTYLVTTKSLSVNHV